MVKKKRTAGQVRKRVIAIICLVLAFLLVGTTVFYYFAAAFAEAETIPDRPRYELEMEYAQDDQALLIRQRLVYRNDTGVTLDRVSFSLCANIFRSESTLFYDNEELLSGFPEGYAPCGVTMNSVTVDGQSAPWGFEGDEGIYLSVMAEMGVGEEANFAFDYTLMLGENRVFCGIYDTDVRLSAFYPAVCVYDVDEEGFVHMSPLSFTDWLYTPAADFMVSVTLPKAYLAAGTGTESVTDNLNGSCTHTFVAENVRAFSLSFSREWREETRKTGSGVTLRALGNRRGGNDRALDAAERALALLEDWLGGFPVDRLCLVQSDCAVGAQSYSGVLWLPEALYDDEEALTHAIRFGLAKQYFGLASAARPVRDAWLSDSLCEYVTYLLTESLQGRDAFLKALNEIILPSLSVTVPGRLYVSSEASLFSRGDYQTVVLDRGAAVFHELRSAMGMDEMLLGLRYFYEMGLDGHTLTEVELTDALSAADGRDWTAFLTDWLFNISDYAAQDISFYE